MADLVTNLYLRTQHFDQSIQNVQKQLDALNKTLLDVDKKISKPKRSLLDFSNILSSSTVKSLTKFAGTLGLTMTSFEAFDKLIKSSQTTSDAFDKVIAGVTGTVDEFFTALSTGDFTSMTMGLGSIIDKAVEAQAALDQLGNTMMSYNYFSSKFGAEFNDAITVLRDKSSTTTERDAANKEIKDLLVKQQEINNGYVNAINDVIQKTATKGTLLDYTSFDRGVFDRTMYLDAKQDSNTKDKLAAEYKEYEAKVKKLQKEFATTVSVGNGVFTRVTDFDNPEYQAQIKALNNEYRDAVFYNELLVKMSDDELNNFVGLYQNIDNANRVLSSMRRQAARVNNSELSSNTTKAVASTSSKSTKVETPVPEGSIAALNQEIASLRKQFEYAADDGTRQGLSKAINDAEVKKKMLQSIAEKPIERLSDGLKDIAKKNPLEGMYTSDPDKSSNVDSSFLAYFKNLEMPFQKDDETLDYLTTIGSLMGNISGATDNATAAWLNYFQNILQGTIALLPLLASLFSIKAMEGIAEQSKMPWPLNIIAMAATAAGLMASIANVPKFATGGIVSGSSFVGDNVIARVNSGEMILNTRQQANLFSMLDGGARTNVQGANVVKWRIEGRDLVGVMHNQINKTSKYK